MMELMQRYEEKRNSIIWQKWAVRAFFFVGGFGGAIWVPLIPLLKNRLGIGEDVLGLLLLCVGIGSMISMPFSGGVALRFGCRRVLLVAALIYAALLPVLCVVTDITVCAVSLLLFGSVTGNIDVSVNIAAIGLEKKIGRPILSGLHAMWSLGGFVGAGAFSLGRQYGLTPLEATFCAVVIMIVLTAFFNYYIADMPDMTGNKAFIAFPHGIVILIGIAAMIAFIGEGTVMDWSGVFLTSFMGLDISMAGMGYAVFSIAMVCMRLSGDFLIRWFGGKRIVLGSVFIAIFGFLLIIKASGILTSFGGFFCIGLGIANIVPIFFSLAGKQKSMPVPLAMSAVSTLGYTGILLGPAVIGFLAKQTSLIYSFALVAGLLGILEFLTVYVYKHLGRPN